MRLITALAIAIGWGQAAETLSKPLTVCEAIAHRDQYNGKIIAIRGIERGGTEGTALIAAHDCEYRLVTRGVTWANLICLAYPNNRSPVVTDHAPFQVDRHAMKKSAEEASRAHYDPTIDQLVATFVGLFVTYADLDRRVNRGLPGALTLGFGDMGAAPAQLVIRSRTDVVVTHGPLPNR